MCGAAENAVPHLYVNLRFWQIGYHANLDNLTNLGSSPVSFTNSTLQKIHTLELPRNGTSGAPSPTMLNLQQFLSMGERCSPLQIFGQVSVTAKSLRSVLRSNSGRLCSFLIPNSSLLIPHSSLSRFVCIIHNYML